MDLAGKTFLVTGGSRGIGRAVTRRLTSAGAAVVVAYRQNAAAARALCDAVAADGTGRVEAVAADVGKHGDVVALVERIRGAGHGLDGIVHSAAMGRFQPLLEVRPIDWELAFRVNAHALLLLVRESLGILREPGASIVALSSLGSHRYVPFYGAIGASKAALESLVRSLAVELAPRGQRVNAVSAGFVDGETMRSFPQFEVLRDAAVQRTPANRLGTEAEVASVVAFLCGEESRWINGQTLIVDGGMSLL